MVIFKDVWLQSHFVGIFKNVSLYHSSLGHLVILQGTGLFVLWVIINLRTALEFEKV